MPKTRSHQETQLLARVAVLERLVATMARDSMIKSGMGPADILSFGEEVKKFLIGRMPSGATDREIHEAADKLFSAIASDLGSQDSIND
jgi:hypothetical protein